MKTKLLTKKLLSVVLAMTILLGTVQLAIFADTSTKNYTASVDVSTVDGYKSLLGTEIDGNRYAGRVWTDKSVFKDDFILDGKEVTNDDDFTVVYSALGSSTSVTTETKSSSNLDVVLVLDNSNSMNNNNKMSNVVKEANTLISALVGNDKNNRVAVVTYGVEADTIAGLNHYNTLSLTLRNQGRIQATGTAGSNATGDLDLDTSSGWGSWTNTQIGIDAGMKILYDNANTNRTPIFVVLTDGVANIAVSGEWYDIDGNNADRREPKQITSGVVLSTILNGSYWKSAVENAYGRSLSTFGISVGLGNDSDAYVVMDPANYFSANSSRQLGRTAYSWYTDWLNSNAVVTKQESGQNSWGWPTTIYWAFNQLESNNAYSVTKQQVSENINYIDKHYLVGTDSSEIQDAFTQILETITKPTFNPIVDTVVQGDTTSAVPLTYTDRLGDYMEVKNFKSVNLFGNEYAVNAVTLTNDDITYTTQGQTVIRTINYKYKVGNDERITHPTLGTIFNLSEAVKVTVTSVTEGSYDANGVFVQKEKSAPVQTVKVEINSSALPCIVDAVKVDSENNVTFKETAQLPARVIYTVGLCDNVTDDNGDVVMTLISDDYLKKNTTHGRVNFYSNYFSGNNVAFDGQNTNGDAHVSFTPNLENRYYYHQNSYAVFSNVTNAQGNPLAFDEVEHGIMHDDSFKYIYLTAADIYEWDNGVLKEKAIADDKKVYTYIEWYKPMTDEDGEQVTDSDGNVLGELVYLLAYANWSELKNALTAVKLDNSSGTNEWVYVNEDMPAMTVADLGDYIESNRSQFGTNTALTNIRARIAPNTLRLPRLHNMTETKRDKALTGTADNIYAPEFNSVSANEGDIIVWLGNNGVLSAEAPDAGIEISKTVTAAAQYDINIEETFTFQIVNSASSETKTYDAVHFDALGVTSQSSVSFTDGKATVSLKAGEKIRILGMDSGTVYTVSENVSYNYSVASVNGDNTATTATITVPGAGYAAAAFVNTPKNLGNLTISKIITHPFGANYTIENDQSFRIKVELQGANVINRTFKAKHSTDNSITSVTTDGNVFYVDLKNGEQIEIFGLEDGVKANGTELYLNSANQWVEYTAGGEWYTGYDAPVYWDNDVNTGNHVAEISGGHTAVATVTNNYNPAKVDPVNLVIEGNKYFTYQGNDYWESANNQYSFDVVLEMYKDGQWKNVDTVTAVNTDKFTFDLSSVSFDKPGVYSFQAYEAIPDNKEEHIFYDQVYHTFSVVVSEPADSWDGRLDITSVHAEHAHTVVTNSTNGYTVKTDFTNEYMTVVDALATIKVQKELTNNSGSPLVNLEGYQFGIYTDENCTTAATKDSATGVEMIEMVATDAVGEGCIDIRFSKPDTFVYYIKEINAVQNKMTYDSTVVKVTIVVEDNNQGSLIVRSQTYEKVTADADKNVEQTTDGEIVFKNIYNPTAATVNFDVTKVLDGRTLKDNEFKFVLTQVTDEANPINKEAWNNANGDVNFGDISLTKVGVYNFTISEVKPTNKLDGVTYDDTIYYVRVTVSDNNGELQAVTEVYNVPGNAMIFNNAYTAAATDIAISAKKQLNGRDMIDGEFNFALIEVTDETATTVKLGGVARYAENDTDGNVSFDKIEYDQAGEYYYAVFEANDGKGGIVYSDVHYVVKVTVTDIENGEYTGQLKATADKTAADLLFINTYSASAEVTLSGYKYLIGKDLEDNDFSFTLYESNANKEKISEIDTQFNKNGAFEFTLSYTQADVGTHYYIVKEVNGGTYKQFDENDNQYSMYYDNREYFVEVSVADNLHGTLTTNVTKTNILTGSNYNDLVFVNTYTDIAVKQVFSAENPEINIDGRSVSVGEVLTYTLNYYNGNDAQADVVIKDIVPDGTTYVADSADNGGIYNAHDNTVTWDIKNIPAGETITVSFNVKVSEAEPDITNKASIIYGNNEYTTNETVNYTYAKKVDKEEATIGEQLNYSIEYKNTTGEDTVISIVDKLDKGLIVDVNSINLGGVYDHDKHTITWNLTVEKDSAPVIVRFSATVVSDARGEIKNTVDIIENDVTIKTNTVKTEIYVPKLKVEKKQAVNDSKATTKDIEAKAGDTVTYSITVENDGDGKAIGVVITDTFQKDLVLIKESLGNNAVVDGNTVKWDIGEMPAGESVTVSFKVTVPTVDKDTVWKNVATVTSSNDEEKVTNEVEASTKDPNPDVPQTGDYSNVHLWVVLLFVSACAVTGICILRKKSQKEIEE